MVEWYPPWEKQFAFENMPFAPQKERIVFQPSILRGYVRFRNGILQTFKYKFYLSHLIL